jgi:hypothetical protein
LFVFDAIRIAFAVSEAEGVSGSHIRIPFFEAIGIEELSDPHGCGDVEVVIAFRAAEQVLFDLLTEDGAAAAIAA